MIYKDSFERTLQELKDRQQDLGQELTQLPDGELYVREREGSRFYFQRLRKEGNRKKEHRIGISKDKDMLGALVRKKYVLSALELIDNDIDVIQKVLVKYKPADENSVMEGFVRKYPELAGEVYYVKESLDEWADAFKEQSDYHTEHLTSTASDGTKRRSKGEILIGVKLKHYRIPYRYEAPVHPDLPYMPDFTIRRPRDGKFIYWEHFGMVTDKDYMKSNKEKLGIYEEYGIVPWDNLIITYDQSDGGINEKLIDALIHGWLL